MKVVKNIVNRLSKSKGIFGVIVGLILGLGTGGLLLAQTESQDWFSNGGMVRAQQLKFESTEKNDSDLNQRYINISEESQTKAGDLGIGIKGTPEEGFTLSVGGPVNVNSNVISGISRPVNNDDAVNLGFLNQRLNQLSTSSSKTGDFVALGSQSQYKTGPLGIGIDRKPNLDTALAVGGPINVTNNLITGVAPPEDGNDAVNLEYLKNNYGSASGSNGSSSLAQTLNQGNTSGGTDIQMTDGSTIKNVPPPTGSKEVATKEYVQQLMTSAGSNTEGGTIEGRVIEGTSDGPLSVLVEGGCDPGFSVEYTGTTAGQSITEGFECVPGQNLGQIEFNPSKEKKNELNLISDTVGVQPWLKEVDTPRQYCRERGLFVPNRLPIPEEPTTEDLNNDIPNPASSPPNDLPQPASYAFMNGTNVKNASIINQIEQSDNLKLADGWKRQIRTKQGPCDGLEEFVSTSGSTCISFVEKEISGPAVVACVNKKQGTIVDPEGIVEFK